MRLALALALATVCVCAPAAAKPLVNGDFEAGSLQGWSAFANSAVRRTVWDVPPTSGSQQAYLIAGTEGCYYCGTPEPYPSREELGIRSGDYDNPVLRTSWVGHINGSAIVQDFNAPREALLQFDLARLENDGCAGPPNWQWDIATVLVNGTALNLCGGYEWRQERLTEGGSRGGQLVYGPDGLPDHQIGYRSFTGYSRYTVPLADFTPVVYPGLTQPGYRLAFFTGQDGGDLAGGYAILVDNVRIVGRVPEPGSLALLLGAWGAALAVRRTARTASRN